MSYDVYSAFGNKVRVKLLLCLSRGPKNVSELIATCGLAQSAVSQHLKKLKAARLVKTTKDGKEVRYFLTHASTRNICTQLMDLDKKI